MYQLYSHRPQSANLVMFYHVVPCRVHPHRAQFHAPTAWDRSDVPKTEDIYKSVQIKSRKFQKMDEHGITWYKIGMDLCSSFFIYALNVFFSDLLRWVHNRHDATLRHQETTVDSAKWPNSAGSQEIAKFESTLIQWINVDNMWISVWIKID